VAAIRPRRKLFRQAGRAPLYALQLCRIHTTLRIAPAMTAGVTDHVWSVADIVAMIDAAEPAPAKRGPCMTLVNK
jgi:hypothetical protein